MKTQITIEYPGYVSSAIFWGILNIPAPIVELIDIINKDNNPTFYSSIIFGFSIFIDSKLIK